MAKGMPGAGGGGQEGEKTGDSLGKVGRKLAHRGYLTHLSPFCVLLKE